MGTYSITPTVAQGMIGGSTSYAEALGASPLIKIYSGSVPATAAASLASAVLLATLTGASTPISGTSDTGTAGRATWGAIASATAAATGTASFFRTTNSAGTAVDQGSVGTTGTDCVLNTVAITSGSTVSITARTNDLPYGP
jgi:hypothetical protein